MAFLRGTAPFDTLPDAALEAAAAALETGSHRPGARLITAGGPPSPYLWIVRSGSARLERDGTALEVFEEGDVFGTSSLLARRTPFDVVAREDLVAYRLPEEKFRDLLAHASFTRFFTEHLGHRLRTAFEREAAAETAGDVYAPVGALVTRKPVAVPAAATVRDAAEAMRRERVGSVLVDGEPRAILTDRDLRDRVLAAGLPSDTPARSVSSSPVRSVPADTPVYAAWRTMARHGVKHLPLERDGTLVGVVSQTDLLRHHAVGPLLAMKRVEELERDSLPGYGADVHRMVVVLESSGVDPWRIARLVSHLNDALMEKVLGWAVDELGPAPGPWAFLVYGSEGRFEQTLLTDQDNALAWGDGAPASQAYFSRMAERAVADLVRAGFPPCPGGYMATAWNGTLAAWTERFDRWVQSPTAEAILKASIFFDFRSVAGDLDLAPVAAAAAAGKSSAPFLTHLAGAALQFRPPLGAFGRIRDEAGAVDLKKGGLAPIAGIARVHGLAAGCPLTNSAERLQAAARAGVIRPDDADTLAEAQRFLLSLRLRAQLEDRREGRPMRNTVALAALTSRERRHLREAFGAVRDAQSELALRYRLESS